MKSINIFGDIIGGEAERWFESEVTPQQIVDELKAANGERSNLGFSVVNVEATSVPSSSFLVFGAPNSRSSENSSLSFCC